MRHFATIGLLWAVASSVTGCSWGGHSYPPTTLGESVSYDYEGDQIDQAASQAETWDSLPPMRSILPRARTSSFCVSISWYLSEVEPRFGTSTLKGNLRA